MSERDPSLILGTASAHRAFADPEEISSTSESLWGKEEQSFSSGPEEGGALINHHES